MDRLDKKTTLDGSVKRKEGNKREEKGKKVKGKRRSDVMRRQRKKGWREGRREGRGRKGLMRKE